MKLNNVSPVIEVFKLSKRFDDVTAVKSITFNIFEGEIFGFLGPNGAGKTTTISMLTGLVRPDAGKIHIAGIDCSKSPKAAQHLVGVVPDESNLYPELSGYENLCFCGALYGMRKRERQTKALELLKLFDLEEAADRKFAGYSKGMKRKLTIAAGIIHNPRILFLDEPTTGIDVVSARQIRQLIADLNSHGTTIFLTTHYIEEAERLCRRIGFIVKGDLVRIDTVDNLMRQTSGRYAMRFTLAKKVGGLCDAVLDAFPQLNCQVTSGNAFIVDSAKPLSIGPLVRLLEDYGAEVYEARKVQPSLEDVFVSITGIAASAMQQDKEKHNAGGH